MCILIDKHRFTVDIARTPEEQQRGLQHRNSLRRNRGMIFMFPQPKVLTFWMKDCNIPLDILFFNQDRMVGVADSAPPCKGPADTCVRYQSSIPADRVVELKAGTRKLLHIDGQGRLEPCNAGQELAP